MGKPFRIGGQFDRFRILEALEGPGYAEVYTAVDDAGRPALLYLREGEPEGFMARLDALLAVNGRLRCMPVVLGGGTLGPVAWVATERCDGASLRELLGGVRRPAIPLLALEQAVTFASALDAAHGLGLLHGDLSPARIVSGLDNEFKLVGLGLAQLFGMSSRDAVRSPAYRAPEMLREGILDVRTDVYALGMTLYEMIGLRRPYAGLSGQDLLWCALVEPPTPVETFVAMSAPVAEVVRRSTAKDAGARYRSMSEVLVALATASEEWLSVREPSERYAKSGVRIVGGRAGGAARILGPPASDPDAGATPEDPDGSGRPTVSGAAVEILAPQEWVRTAPSPVAPQLQPWGGGPPPQLPAQVWIGAAPSQLPPPAPPTAEPVRAGKTRRVAKGLGLVLAGVVIFMAGIAVGAMTRLPPSPPRLARVLRLPLVIPMPLPPQPAPSPDPSPAPIAVSRPASPPPRASRRASVPSPAPPPSAAASAQRPSVSTQKLGCGSRWYECNGT